MASMILTDTSIPRWEDRDYVRFSELVLERFGLSFPEKRYDDLERGVRQAFAASPFVDLEEYYRALQDADGGAVETERLVNALTIGETHFFRDAAQFNALYHHVLPQLIERRRTLRTLRIWSAGCASGEEPYSIAMMLRELLPDVDEWAVTILGTDINTEALDRARRGVYGNWAFREERAKRWQERYFTPEGQRYELIPQVRRMVTFDRLNLAEDSYPAYETNTMLMDLILCRNVTIYFGGSVTGRVVDRFYDALVDGGWLVVGHSEPSLGTYRRFQVRNCPGTILYQRTGTPTSLPMDWEWPADVSPRQEEAPAAFSPRPILDLFVLAPLPTGPPPVPDDTETLPPATEQDPTEWAQKLLSYGQSEQARDLLLQEIRREGEHAPTCILLGQAYANLGCWGEAERWCRRAVSLNRLTLDAYYTLALVLQHQGRIDEALEAMKKVVYIDRNDVLGHFGLANLYHSKGRLPQTLKSLDNTYRLLAARAGDEVIPGSGGITVDRLRETVIRQQQQWGEMADLQV